MTSSDLPPPKPPKRHLWAGPREPEREPDPPPAPPPAPPKPSPPRRDLFPWIAGALALAVVGATAGAIVSARGDNEDSTTSAPQTVSAPTTPAPAPTTPSSTVPTPPPNPRHIVRRATVGGAALVTDDGVAFRVLRVREVKSIPHTRFGGPITGSSSRRLIRADIGYVNHTASSVDVFCGGYGATLRDSAGHHHAPMHNYLDIKGNDSVCATKIPPGGSTHVALAFKIPRALQPTGLYVYNAKAADFDGSDTKIFFAKP